jgi:hypothetical protein
VRVLAVSLLAATGCAQLLGLDNTTLDTGDAPIVSDACLGVPASCVSSTGRTICGQLFDTGTNAGKPLTVATPTGAACAGGEGGPCAFTATAYAQALYLAGDKSAPIAGAIDDCGRFVVPDVDVNTADVAIEFIGSDVTTATLVNARPAEIGEDKDVAAFALTQATTAAWATQLDPNAPPDVSAGFLISFTAGTNRLPLALAQAANDGGVPYANPPGTVPWAGYFVADSRFGTLDPAQTQTANTGTAIAVVPLDTTLQLEGVRTGHARCKVPNLKLLAGLWIHVVEVDC